MGTTRKTAKKKTAAKTKANFDEERRAVFEALKKIAKRHARSLSVASDGPTGYSLECKKTKMPNGNPMPFVGLTSRKSYVSFYLFPVYVEPALLDDCSDALMARMQGKSCFNFKRLDPVLDELDQLTRKCFAHWKAKDHL